MPNGFKTEAIFQPRIRTLIFLKSNPELCKRAFTPTETDTDTDKNGLYRTVLRCSYCTETLMTLGTVAILLVSVSISVRGLIITARNEVGEGYVYVCVILFTGRVPCPGGGLVWSRGDAWWRTPRYGHCCGRYASYWNAFLFSLVGFDDNIENQHDRASYRCEVLQQTAL